MSPIDRDVSGIPTITPAFKLNRAQWKGCQMCNAKYTKDDWDDGGSHDFLISGATLYYYDI